ncbi:ribosome biogenesis GTPase [Clostridium amylolyticum]|uniref:Small ribosomal subunit biogenesis GTPase RsgA n=1 Tax=Clostridium amylolyticum TaxID=1121298 RepID=A0A1M6C5Z2_9CLOT|nr:ribosome small subunit-dependent GTPase A [Clostridium amylolyticum]SHI56164.1 ribosome biogenesis GTPase [Clostridium amylolyticum]
MNNIKIRNYGYSEFYERQIEALNLREKDLIPGRVVEVHKEQYKIVTEFGEKSAKLKGSIFYNGDINNIYPAVGDFVLVKNNPYGEDIIYIVLDRKSKFSRMDSFYGTEQVVATNFDYVFVITSLNHDFNIRRMERYITSAWQSGAIPVIVLTKADLCDDYSEYVESIEKIALGIKIVAVSSVTREGIEDLSEYIKPSKTIVFLGSSGVGKSSLVNAMALEDVMKVNSIREDDSKGRHTTTHRQLIMLKNGAMIIDTPGMRELGVWNVEEGLDVSFSDIEEFESRCKFRDCNHKSEPGCAVREAIENGELSKERWESYVKLKKEAKFAMWKESEKNRIELKKGSKKKYKKEELNVSLDLVESGWSYSEVSKDTKLNKSIIAREMRKRLNLKSKDQIK